MNGRPAWLTEIVFGDESGKILAAVGSCPVRGMVLPVSAQSECGCGELAECRAGKGNVPGRVSMDDCLVCRIGELGMSPS
jgi:hypothetical protein